MKQIKLCECCGEPYEIDDADTDLHVCEHCNVYDEDLIGIIDFDEKD